MLLQLLSDLARERGHCRAEAKMVLWEIALGTAYFLGLRRTYRLGLRVQRKLITKSHPEVRQFLQRRTRNVFDLALKVHLKIRDGDIKVGGNMGNMVLQWLDRMKPNAQIRSLPPSYTNVGSKIAKQSDHSSYLKNRRWFLKYDVEGMDRQSTKGHLLSAARNVWHKSLPTIAMVMRPMRTVVHNIQYRQCTAGGTEFFTVKYGKFGGVTRNDLRQWILHN